MPRYRRRRNITDAVKWDGTNEALIAITVLGAEFSSVDEPVEMHDTTIRRWFLTLRDETKVWVPEGYYVAKRQGFIPSRVEFWTIAPEVFEAEYEVDA